VIDGKPAIAGETVEGEGLAPLALEKIPLPAWWPTLSGSGAIVFGAAAPNISLSAATAALAAEVPFND
jgi:hypothetical protein